MQVRVVGVGLQNKREKIGGTAGDWKTEGEMEGVDEREGADANKEVQWRGALSPWS